MANTTPEVFDPVAQKAWATRQLYEDVRLSIATTVDFLNKFGASCCLRARGGEWEMGRD